TDAGFHDVYETDRRRSGSDTNTGLFFYQPESRNQRLRCSSPSSREALVRSSSGGGRIYHRGLARKSHEPKRSWDFRATSGSSSGVSSLPLQKARTGLDLASQEICKYLGPLQRPSALPLVGPGYAPEYPG